MAGTGRAIPHLAEAEHRARHSRRERETAINPSYPLRAEGSLAPDASGMRRGTAD